MTLMDETDVKRELEAMTQARIKGLEEVNESLRAANRTIRELEAMSEAAVVKLEEENHRLRLGLEAIIRECGDPEQGWGPVAVDLARAALQREETT